MSSFDSAAGSERIHYSPPKKNRLADFHRGHTLLKQPVHFTVGATAAIRSAVWTQVPALRTVALYGTAALLMLVGLLLTYYLQRLIGFPNAILLIPIVILSSVRWGARVGVFATLLAATGVAVLMEPAWSLAVARPGDRILLLIFVGVALVSGLVASQQHRLGQQLRANEAELRAIFDLAAVGTGMVAPSGRFLRVNEQLCKLTGFTREELLSKSVADITHPDDRKRDRDIIQELLKGERDRWSIEKRYLRSDGEVIWVLVNGTIVHGNHDHGPHFIAHAADITDRRRTDDALREASRLKDEFLATLSHELRTPLNVVAGWTQILRRDQANHVHLARGLSVIERNTDSLRRLTDDLIGMSSVLTGRIRLEQRLVDLRGVLDDAVESIGLAAQAKGLSIKTDFERVLPVRGDEARLRQVFWNLLSNALKFTAAGGTITATARVKEDQVVVQVSDTGIGIPPAFLPYVFEKFRQEDASHTREHQGLGLGLTIARQFTELHGGTISAGSKGRNQGAVFTVMLPIANPAGGSPAAAERAS
jgi:PAS domain S-box-containing protein